MQSYLSDIIVFPPLKNQRRIVETIRYSFSSLETLEDSIRDIANTVGVLRRSVLAEAFAGRLVPQNPDDEPASLLLERIAASHPRKARRKAKVKI